MQFLFVKKIWVAKTRASVNRRLVIILERLSAANLVISVILSTSPMISTKAIRQTRQTSQLNKCVSDCRLVSLSSHFHRVTCHVHVLSNYNSSNKGVKFVETCQDGDVLIYTTCYGSNIFFGIRLKQSSAPHQMFTNLLATNVFRAWKRKKDIYL